MSLSGIDPVSGIYCTTREKVYSVVNGDTHQEVQVKAKTSGEALKKVRRSKPGNWIAAY